MSLFSCRSARFGSQFQGLELSQILPAIMDGDVRDPPTTICPIEDALSTAFVVLRCALIAPLLRLGRLSKVRPSVVRTIEISMVNLKSRRPLSGFQEPSHLMPKNLHVVDADGDIALLVHVSSQFSGLALTAIMAPSKFSRVWIVNNGFARLLEGEAISHVSVSESSRPRARIWRPWSDFSSSGTSLLFTMRRQSKVRHTAGRCA